MATRLDFAKIVMAMNYGELKAVAKELSEMKNEDVRPKIETTEEYAEMLFDWAESTVIDG